jgi:hypothetical protein
MPGKLRRYFKIKQTPSLASVQRTSVDFVTDQHEATVSAVSFFAPFRPTSLSRSAEPDPQFLGNGVESEGRPGTSTSLRSFLGTNDIAVVLPAYLISERPRRVAYLYPNLR